jgi:hypothetical protein
VLPHVLLPVLLAVAPQDTRECPEELLKGVTRIAAPGIPGGVCAFGPQAFVVVVGTANAPVVAGAEAGDGRVLALGHNGYLGEALETDDTGRFARNALVWLSGGKRSPRVACPGKPELARRLADLGLKAETHADLEGVDCVVVDAGAPLSRDRLDELAAFVEDGGGLLAAATGWGWQQLNADLTLARDLPGNRLLTHYGLAFTLETVRPVAEATTFETTMRPPALAHAGTAFETLRDGRLDAATRPLATARLTAALGCLPDHETMFVLPLRRYLDGNAAEDTELAALARKNRERGWRPIGERWGEWRVLGPFAVPKPDIAATLAPEKELMRLAVDSAGPDLAAPWRSRKERLHWRRLELPEDGRDLDVGEIDLERALRGASTAAAPTSRAAAYLYRRIEADEESEHMLQLGADDGLRIWLNGALVVDRLAAQSVDKERVDLVLRLPRGTSHLVAKVVNDTGRWSFRMQEPSSPLAQAAIDAAVHRALAFLVNTQQVDGSWSGEAGYGPGMTAYVTYSLSRSGVTLDHPSLRRALAYVEAHEAHHTYSLSCRIQALAACRPEEHEQELARDVERMIGWQESSGLWGYPVYPDGTARPVDLSTTLYAALALRAAHGHGHKIAADVWNRMIEGTLRCWNGEAGQRSRKNTVQPAGFSYRIDGKTTGSMTTAGVSILAIAREALEGRVDRRLSKECETALESGLAWIEDHSNWGENVGNTRFHMFWVYGVERAGSLLGRDVLGGVPWHRAGAEYLIGRQNEDGSWEGATGDTHKTRDTLLGLLFLSRATRPMSGAESSREKALAAEGPELDVWLRATGSDPFDVWITGFGERVRKDLIGRGLRYPDVSIVRYVARPVSGGDEIVLAEVAPREGVAVQRYEGRLHLPAPGSWSVVAEVDVTRPPASKSAPPEKETLRSGSLSVEVRAPFDEAVLAYPLDADRNLLRGATTEASSHHGTQPSAHAIDGLHGTRWHSAIDDAEPWWRVRLARAVLADRLLLSHAWPRVLDRDKAQPTRVEVIVNGETHSTIAIDPDPLRKTVVELRRTRVLELELRIVESKARRLGTDAVGFSEIELVASTD